MKKMIRLLIVSLLSLSVVSSAYAENKITAEIVHNFQTEIYPAYIKTRNNWQKTLSSSDSYPENLFKAQIGISLLSATILVKFVEPLLAEKDMPAYQSHFKNIEAQLAGYSDTNARKSQAEEAFKSADAILELVAMNPDQDKQILKLLSTDRNKMVRQAANRQLSVSPEKIQSERKPVNKAATLQLWVIFESTDGGYDIAGVSKAIQDGADVNFRNEDGFTPLYKSSVFGDSEVAKILLSAGADVDAKVNGSTPLAMASYQGYEAVVKVLIDGGADLEAKDPLGSTPLWVASMKGHIGTVALLLNAGADANALNKKKSSPLHMAASAGDIDVVKLLLASGADIHAVDIAGATPLKLAIHNGHTKVVELMKASNNNQVETPVKQEPSDVSTITPVNEEATKYLFALLLSDTPPAVADIHKIIFNGADVNAKHENGIRPLFVAAAKGYADAVKILLNAGADVDAQVRGITPLIIASSQGYREVVEHLLKAGADTEVKDRFGSTALIKASSKGHIPVVSLLVSAKANINAMDENHSTALLMAIIEKKTRVAGFLLMEGAEVNTLNDEGFTPLHTAVMYGDTQLVKWLLMANADVTVKDDKGMTPLQYAYKLGHEEIIGMLKAAQTR